jgi:class 3 adenylate cyclase
VTLKTDLTSAVSQIVLSGFNERDGIKVPEPQDLALTNEAVKLSAAVLYADIADSTLLVEGYKNWFAAKVYKAFLASAARIIKWNNGVITAYDGDRIMGVYIGEVRLANAARTALQIRDAVDEIIQPAIRSKYPTNTYRLKHVVGVDASPLYVVREGIRGGNDLVWIGRAANYAAKLAAWPDNYTTYVTADVYNSLPTNLVKDGGGNHLWYWRAWQEKNLTVYCTNAHVTIS